MIRSPKNFMVGLIFTGLALLFGISSMRLNLGTAGQMGPGYFPLTLSIALGLLGLAVLVLGFRKPGEAPGGTNVRGVILVMAAVAVFAFGVRPLGLVPTVMISSFLFSSAGRGFHPVSAVLAALVLSLGSWAIFVIGLRMPWAPFGTLFS
jgi:putative tricarboxylic transport membrane protein